MARSEAVEKGKGSKNRLGSKFFGVSSNSAEKIPPLSSRQKSSRKRALDEVIEIDAEDCCDASTEKRNSVINGSSRKVIRIDPPEREDGHDYKVVEGLGTKNSRVPESSIQEFGSKLSDVCDSQKSQILLSKWKRLPKVLDHQKRSSDRSLRGSLESFSEEKDLLANDVGPSSAAEERKFGKQEKIREHELIRKVLRTAHLAEENERAIEQEEDAILLENDTVSISSRLKPRASTDRDRKRRAGKGDASPPKQEQKKPRIDVVTTEGSSRSGELKVRTSLTNTWKRLKRENTRNRPSASIDMGISVSEAWKRLREEKVTETSGSSLNGRSDSDLSMRSSDSESDMFEERSKKARYDLSLPCQGREQVCKISEPKETPLRKRLRQGSEFRSSSSSGSHVAHSSYLHNRRWKRPRFEDLMSMKSGSWKRQDRQLQEAAEDSGESSRKRIQCDTPEKPRKKQRK